MQRLVAVIAGLAVAACASSGSSTSTKAGSPACAAQPIDSVYLRAGPVYRECEVDRRVRMADSSRRLMASMPPEAYRQGSAPECPRVEMEFVVDTTGAPEVGTARVTSTNDPAYARATIALVPRLRFSPATRNGVPVRQVVRHVATSTSELRRVEVGGGQRTQTAATSGRRSNPAEPTVAACR